MLVQSEIEFAISIQNRCYKLLTWLGNAENEGFWTHDGRPIRRFKLNAQDIMQAEKSLLSLLKKHAGQ